MDSALLALRQHFGFEDFREGQREVISAILDGHDTVVVMPTGGGKSLCFQLPAMMKQGATVVVSPLIALMKDQVDALNLRNLPATFINSSISFEEQKTRINAVSRGMFRLVYVAPERFRSAHFVEALRNIKIELFAIDEAHCISQWGHDFRPDYLRLREAIDAIGRPQVVALTATATPYVRSDIIEQLKLASPRAFVSGFDRPNLSIDVVHIQKEREKVNHIKALAKKTNGSGIVYASTRKAVEQVALKLRAAGLGVVAYHAGMDEAERTRAQDQFMSGQIQMIAATNAFGMGIDKPDIRFVAHYQFPGSIEAYYQEIGRAGRDGLPATCALLFNYADKRTQDYFIEGSFPPPNLVADVYRALVATGQKRIELSAGEIAVRANVRNEMAVQSALVMLEKAGHLERGHAGDNRASVRLLMPPQIARASVGDRDTNLRKVLFGLLGNFGLNERLATEIDVSQFAQTLGIDPTAARRGFGSLASAGVISYQPSRRTRGIIMLDETPQTQLRIRPQDVARRAALEQRKLREMISFCYAKDCYRAFILNYFGDRHVRVCGTCGNCAPEHFTTRVSAGKAPIDPPSALDSFISDSAPVGLELDQALAEQSKRAKANRAAEAAFRPQPSQEVAQLRSLSEEEVLIVRKVLACAARMKGKFGKGMLASTLRGSRARNVVSAGLDQLSTYGILRDLTQDDLVHYIEELISAKCLKVSAGAYPTISISSFGEDVMRQRATVELLKK